VVDNYNLFITIRNIVFAIREGAKSEPADK